MSNSIDVEKYFSNAVVVRMNSKYLANEFKKIGGTWNSKLKGGPGWIFPKRLRRKIEDLIISNTVKNKKKISSNEEESPLQVRPEKDSKLPNISSLCINKGSDSILPEISSFWLDNLEKKLNEIETMDDKAQQRSQIDDKH